MDVRKSEYRRKGKCRRKSDCRRTNIGVNSMKKILKFIRNIPALLALLPRVMELITKARELYGSDQVQGFLQAIDNMMSGDNAAPPDRTVDGNSTTPVNPKREQERRFRLFQNRTRLFRRVPEADLPEMCAKYNIEE